MIVSIHIADLGPRGALAALRHPPRPAETPGLRYAETTITAPIGAGPLPVPSVRRAGMIAAWDDDGSLERFCAEAPIADRFAAGWQARLEPLHVFGAWPEMPGLPEDELSIEDEEPVAVLTLGRLRLLRFAPFLRAGSRAEAEAADEPGLLAATGLARPPHLFSTFSLWRSPAAMRDYAFRESGAHRAAVRSDQARAFHHQSAFIRFRPYASSGSWDGRNPLAEVKGDADSGVVRQGRRETE